jgi:hypothetical protein
MLRAGVLLGWLNSQTVAEGSVATKISGIRGVELQWSRGHSCPSQK